MPPDPGGKRLSAIGGQHLASVVAGLVPAWGGGGFSAQHHGRAQGPPLRLLDGTEIAGGLRHCSSGLLASYGKTAGLLSRNRLTVFFQALEMELHSFPDVS